MDIIKMIEMSQRYIVGKNNDDEFEIEHKNSSVAAIIDRKSNVAYFVTGVYNSGAEWAEIDLEAFNELKNFCELICKQEESKCSD